MSDLLEPGQVAGNSESVENNALELVIEARNRDLAGITIRRVLPFYARRMVGPWIFFDHIGPVEFAPGDGMDVPPHPHINLATVTYVFEGVIMHRDSMGVVQAVEPGAINLMVAGKGGAVRVLIGECFGLLSPVKTYSQTLAEAIWCG